MSDWSTRAFVGHNQPEMSDKSDCENCIEYTSEDACLVKAYLYDLEQRFEKLEQVARKMYQAIAPMHEPCCEDTCLFLGDAGWHIDACCRGFRKQLEALGVSVD